MEVESSSSVSGDPSTRPQVSEDGVRELVQRLYGLTVTRCSELPSYDDRNFHVRVVEVTTTRGPVDGNGYVLKVLNALDSRRPSTIRFQHDAIFHAARRGVQTPMPVPNLRDEYFSVERLPRSAVDVRESGEVEYDNFIVRLLHFVPGRILADVLITPHICRSLGVFAANLDIAMQDFDMEKYQGASRLWNLEQVPKLKPLLVAVSDDEEREMVATIIDVFQKDVLENLKTLRFGIIHSDFNEHNIVLHPDEDLAPDSPIKCILDWGDSLGSYYVFEVSIAMAYMALCARKSRMDPRIAAAHVLDGFTSRIPLTEAETRVLRLCVCARIAQSLVVGAFGRSRDPSNLYLEATARTVGPTLRQLWEAPKDVLEGIWSSVPAS